MNAWILSQALLTRLLKMELLVFLEIPIFLLDEGHSLSILEMISHLVCANHKNFYENIFCQQAASFSPYHYQSVD